MLFSKRKIKNTRQRINFQTAGVFAVIFCFVFSMNISGALAAAGVNKQINYQGRLGDDAGDIVADGDYDIIFKLYTVDTAGTAIWTGTYTTANGNPITVSKGIFSVLLGSDIGNEMNLDFSEDTYYLGVTVGTDNEMVPRKRIASVPQSYNANNLVGDGYIKITGAPTGTGADQGTVYINPASATAGQTLLGLAVGGTQKFKIDEAGNLAAAGDLAVNGGDITSAGALTLAPLAGSNLNVSLATTGDFAVNTSQLYVDTSAGFVGIGTATPGASLDVVSGQLRGPNGSVVAGNGPGIAFTSYPDTGIAANGTNLGWWESGVLALDLSNTAKEFRVPSDYKFAFSSATNNNSVSDTSFYRNSGGVMRTGGTFLVDGNVGIGTTTPGSPLTIGNWLTFESGVVGTAPDIHFASQGLMASDTSMYLNFDGSNTGTGNFYIGKGALTNAATYLVSVLNNGNVGVGTTTPGTKFHIYDADSAIFRSETDAGRIMEFGASDSGLYTHVGTVTNHEFELIQNNSIRTRIYNNGMDVLESLGVGGNYLTSGVASFVVRGNGWDLLNLQDNLGNEKMTVLNSGNVGIGDATPASLLTVGDGDLFQVNSSGAIVAATGITSSGTINFSGLTASKAVFTDASKNLTSTGTIGTDQGGTGISSYTVGDLLYADSTSTLGKLADVATGNVLISGGIGTAPSWGKVDLTAHISGILPIANGGTGNTSALTEGSVVFAGVDGAYSQNNSNFFWDDANLRLGIGTLSPGAPIDIFGTTNALRLSYDGSNYGEISSNLNGQLVLQGSGTTEAAAIIGAGLAQDVSVKFDGETNDYYVGVDTDGVFKIGGGTDVGTTPFMMVKPTGDVEIGVSGPSALSARLYSYIGTTDVGSTATYAGYFYNNAYNVTQDSTVKYGVYITSQGTFTGLTGAATTNYGLYVNNTSGADTNYSAYFGSGNVGMGALNPDAKLTIATANATTNQLRLRSANVDLYAGDVVGGIDFSSNDLNITTPLTVTASIQALASGTHNASGLSTDLVFSTTNVLNPMAEVMRITKEGYVGIGTNAPESILFSRVATDNSATTIPDAITSGISKIVLKNNDGTLNDKTALAMEITEAGVGQARGGMVLTRTGDGAAHPTLSFVTDPSNGAPLERLTIDPNGNVGIGTASPLARLHTVGRTASAATDFIGLFSETGVTPEATAGLTTALAQKAAVVQGNGGAYFVGRDVTNDIEFIFGTSIAGSAFAGATTNHDFQLRTNNVDRITIKNTTGNVGIGTSNPTYKLQVSSSSTAITPVSLANSVLRLSNSDTTNGNYASIEFGSNDTSGTIRSGAAISGIFTNHDVSMVQSELGFYTRNISGTVNEAMRIDENGNVGIGDTNPAALFTVGNGSLFQVSSTGAVTTTGGIVSLNTNSNFAVNVATGTSTGAVTIGGNANTVTIDSSDWNITAAGAMTGISGITNNAAITSVGGQVNLNVSSNYVINLATGTSTGTITLGGTGTQTISVGNGAGIKTVNLGSATTTSTTTLLSGSGGLNLNVNNSQPTNIATGTSAGAISIGGGSNTVAIDSTSWDISTAGVLSGATGITSSGTINFSGLTASSLVFTDASDNLVSSAASAAVASSITDETGTGLLVFNDSPSLTTPTASSITVTALNVNGTVYSNAGVLTNTNPSDIRLKENVQPLENVLDKIALLKPVTFDWISNGEASRGFIAQEVEKVFPELVGNNGEYKGLYTTDFIPYLVKGIQEQQTQIAESTDQLGDLNLKTNQNITTLEELQSSIDAQLGAVSKNINTINAALATGQASLDDYGARLGIQEDSMASLQTQVAELQILTNQDLNVAQIADNTASVAFISDLLGLDRVDRTVNPGDIDIIGKLSAEKIEAAELVGNVTGDVIGNLTGNVIGNLTGNVTGDTVETKQLIINVDKKDSQNPTIGAGMILSDENSVSIKSEAVTDNSKIYITPIGSTDNQVVYVGNIEKEKGFEVKVDRIDGIKKKDINFNWWIIESKEGGE